ncbi:unnamed protein product [Lactuca virosa]|uniref:Uncharacterized protein n=1 Tax=Lactuca virosa TaxID=75947 RepID=A0AAU9PMJ1_9ASTR|nr:unnamed protein product [Lactuca virosa]
MIGNYYFMVYFDRSQSKNKKKKETEPSLDRVSVRRKQQGRKKRSCVLGGGGSDEPRREGVESCDFGSILGLGIIIGARVILQPIQYLKCELVIFLAKVA